MRILAASPHFEPEGGGLERYAGEVLRRLATRGHDVEAVALTQTGLADDDRGGVTVRRLPARLRVGNTPVDPAFGALVERSVREMSPDVVLAHTPVPFAAETAHRVARRYGVPFVPTYHAGRLRGSNPGLDAVAGILRHTVERRMLAGSARLIAVTPYVRDHALRRHRDRVHVIPPGVDADHFRPDPHGPDVSDVLWVGPLDRSYRWKGVDVLWRAFQQIRRAVPDATLTLVGDGDRRPEFLRRARRDPAIRIPGRLDEDRLVQAYRRARVVVLPSLTDAESFGMVLAEANACGRPVVASRVGGVPDFVRHGDNGLLAAPGDAADLARKIRWLLEDPDGADAMGARGRERVLREHDWGDLAVATERVLEDARGA